MFASRVIAWQRLHGRHDLPWQAGRDPYRIWVSEIMLQQTQVSAVIPYFERFIARFPDLASLAAATQDDVLQAWSGLGYYTRARNLHACACRIMSEHAGRFPDNARTLAELPGIGRSTAAAIAAFAFGERAAILDGNVRRVLCRAFGIEGYPGLSAVERVLWSVAERELPENAIEAYTQGLMDLGATVCTRSRPACTRCPVSDACVARRDARVAELPAPRPRKVTPVRATALLVLTAGAHVLLEKRPPAGIWGGLWSLPEIPAEAGDDIDAISRAAARYGTPVGAPTPLPRFGHAFTHFRLEVSPLRLEVTPQGAMTSDGHRWVALSQAGAEALPAPIRTLLRALSGQAAGA